MALTKSYQAVQSSATNTAGSTTSSGWQSVGYGISGVAQVTNGGTGPTVACSVYVDIADDSSGTHSIQSVLLGTAGTTASTTYYFPFSFGIGSGGDAPYYRIRFVGNTAQSVTVQASAWTTTAIV